MVKNLALIIVFLNAWAFSKTLFIFDFINNTGDSSFDFLCRQIPRDLKLRFTMYDNLNIVLDTVKQNGQMARDPQMQHYLIFGEMVMTGQHLLINVSIRYPQNNEIYKKEIFIKDLKSGHINQKMIVLKTLSFFEDHFLSRIYVESRPSQAVVYLDSVKSGHTPFDTLLFRGKYTLALKKRGYSTLVKNLEINRDNNQYLFALGKKDVENINNQENEKTLPRLFPTALSFGGSVFFAGISVVASTQAAREPYPRIRDFSLAMSTSLLIAGIYGYYMNKKRLSGEPFNK
jgi:hypothetical protein